MLGESNAWDVVISVVGVCGAVLTPITIGYARRAAKNSKESAKHSQASWEHICGPEHPDVHEHPHDNLYDLVIGIRDQMQANMEALEEFRRYQQDRNHSILNVVATVNARIEEHLLDHIDMTEAT